MPIEHLGRGVPDVQTAKEYYDEFMPMVGDQPCFGNGYCPNDWQGAQLLLYPALEEGSYSRHCVGFQRLAFLVGTRAEVHRAHEWARARGDEIRLPEALERDPAMRAAMAASSDAWGAVYDESGADLEAVARATAATTAFYVPDYAKGP
jgi:catechol 2,3-dioxygenase-like lactoylglutathione lyase family enzyme